MNDRKAALQLLPGDYLPTSKRVVMRVDRTGYKVPAGKVRVILHNKRIGTTEALWNSRTMIKVERTAQ